MGEEMLPQKPESPPVGLTAPMQDQEPGGLLAGQDVSDEPVPLKGNPENARHLLPSTWHMKEPSR
jgi:hypothetical protein